MLLSLALATQVAGPAEPPPPPPPPAQGVAAIPPPPPLPEPAGLPRTVIHERGRRSWYRGEAGGRQRIRVGGRLGFGVAGRLAGPLPVRAGFALDVLAAARVPVSRGRLAFGLFPEFGYSLLAGARRTDGHFFTGGFGLGVIAGSAGAAVIPRVVVGGLDRERAVGVRTGLLIEKSKDGGFSLEVAHQALQVPRGVIHELRVTLSLTFLMGR